MVVTMRVDDGRQTDAIDGGLCWSAFETALSVLAPGGRAPSAWSSPFVEPVLFGSDEDEEDEDFIDDDDYDDEDDYEDPDFMDDEEEDDEPDDDDDDDL